MAWTSTFRKVTTENDTVVYEIEYSNESKSFRRLYRVSAIGGIDEIKEVARKQIDILVSNESVVEELLQYLDQPLTE